MHPLTPFRIPQREGTHYKLLATCISLMFSVLLAFGQPYDGEGAFIPNAGQYATEGDGTSDFVIAVFVQPNRTIFVTTEGLTLQLRTKADENTEGLSAYAEERIDFVLSRADIQQENVTFHGAQEAVYQYFQDGSQAPIITNPYREVYVTDVYPGIDWKLTATGQGIKYSFVVHPHADPEQIAIEYKAAGGAALLSDGSIQINSLLGPINEPAPISFDHARTPVVSAFTVKENDPFHFTVGFNVGVYNTQDTLIIDPALWWCTFYGGVQNEAFTHITSDNEGNIIAVGWAESPNFPTLDAGTFYKGTKSVNEDAVIVKFSSTGERLWATFYGGNEEDWAYGAAVDASGNIFVTGETVSSNFPVLNAGTYFQGALHGDEDVFILKFSSSGTRLWATYYGGDNKEGGYAISADAGGNIFVTGYTKSNDFPKLNAGTYYQASMAGVQDAFILKFNNSGSRLWATYYGGSAFDEGNAIAIDSDDEIFLTGTTQSTNFPVYDAGTFYQGTMVGDTDAYVMKFSNIGTRLWASYFGGPDADYGLSAVIDQTDDVYFGGYTRSFGIFTHAPDLDHYWQPINAGGTDLFLLRVSNDGTCEWSTFYGGTSNEYMDSRDALAVNSCNDLYVTQTSWSADMPVLDAGCSSYFDDTNDGEGDIFLTRFTELGVITWATYYGYENEDILSCLEAPVFEGNTLFMTGVYHEYDPGEPVPLANPGGSTYYDGTHNGDDEPFLAKFIPVPLSTELTYSNLCYCLDSAIVTPSCGVEPYSYVWSDGQTDSIATGLCAGYWEVVVTDADCNADTMGFIIDCALPLEILEFTGTNQAGINYLSWEVPALHQSTHYTISRFLENGTTCIYTAVATDATTYAVTDMQYADTMMYYLLTGYDDNGLSTFSQTIAIEPTNADEQLLITYPEYERAAIHYSATHAEGAYVYLLDISGKAVREFVWDLDDGDNTLYFDHPDLPKGNFVVVVNALTVHASAIFHHL